jgi:hypothetical protein
MKRRDKGVGETKQQQKDKSVVRGSCATLFNFLREFLLLHEKRKGG